MKVAVCVCTYGIEQVGQDWLDRGNKVMERLMREQGSAAHYVRWHSEGTEPGMARRSTSPSTTPTRRISSTATATTCSPRATSGRWKTPTATPT